MMKEEEVDFFKILLRNGIYRHDGVKWILQKLREANCEPTDGDMPKILDAESRRCLMKEYHNVRIREKEEMFPEIRRTQTEAAPMRRLTLSKQIQ